MKRSINDLLFKLKYIKVILDKQYIPKDENIIFCGNHLTPLDLKVVNISTKRKIVWLEDNYDICKEELSKGSSIGIFPEGTINIYRLIQLRILKLEKEIIKTNKNPYLRSGDCMTRIAYLQEDIQKELNNLEKAKKELEKLGIKVVNNDILLPFNKDAVKLAYETNTNIVPFTIDYNDLHKIKIRFGEPIKVSSNLETENELLRNKVKHLIYKNY